MLFCACRFRPPHAGDDCRPGAYSAQLQWMGGVTSSRMLLNESFTREPLSNQNHKACNQINHFSRFREYLYARFMLAGFKDSYRKLETSGSAREAILTLSTPILPRRLKHSFARTVPKPFLL
jgi:hypothetical protein